MKRAKKPVIHENASRKIKRMLREVRHDTGMWNMREVARRLEINYRYVHDNLIHGIEPTDTTDHNRNIRIALGLKPRIKKEKPMIQCVRCKQMVSATMSGKPRRHDDRRGSPCGVAPLPLWKKRWMDIPRVARDGLIEHMMTEQYKPMMKWMTDRFTIVSRSRT